MYPLHHSSETTWQTLKGTAKYQIRLAFTLNPVLNVFTVKSLVWLRWPCALVWFYWFDWKKRCRVWFSWVSVLYTSVDSGSSMSCMSWLNVLTRLANCLSWPSALLWLCWPVVWHDWVDLNVLTKYSVRLGWAKVIDKVSHMIELTWTYWQSILHDWVDLKVLTRLATMSSASLSLINHSSWWQASVPANQARNS